MNPPPFRSLRPLRVIVLVLAALVSTACATTPPRAAGNELPEPGEGSPLSGTCRIAIDFQPRVGFGLGESRPDATCRGR